MIETGSKYTTEGLRVLVNDTGNDPNSEQRIEQMLSIASKLVEEAAFEMARLDDPHDVSELILIAGRLDRLSSASARQRVELFPSN